LKYGGLPTYEVDLSEEFSQLMNVEPGERKEVSINQTGYILWGENLKKGYTLVFSYQESGKKKSKSLIVKER